MSIVGSRKYMYDSVLRKNEIKPSPATWKDLAMIILSAWNHTKTYHYVTYGQHL